MCICLLEDIRGISDQSALERVEQTATTWTLSTIGILTLFDDITNSYHRGHIAVYMAQITAKSKPARQIRQECGGPKQCKSAGLKFESKSSKVASQSRQIKRESSPQRFSRHWRHHYTTWLICPGFMGRDSPPICMLLRCQKKSTRLDSPCQIA
jgi:hypothetical protein